MPPRRRANSRRAIAACALSLAAATAALAQDEIPTELQQTEGQTQDGATEGVRVFEPDYYDEFDPVSALDMVFRTPGFSPQESTGGRGLSGVRSNLLINADRPPPKGRTTTQQLRDMPVSRVARLELIDAGARLDIDMQGFAQVMNVVTIPDPPPHYEFEAFYTERGEGDVLQNNGRTRGAEARTDYFWRGHEFSLSVDAGDDERTSPPGFVSVDPTNPTQRVSSLTSSSSSDLGVELDAVFALRGESELALNGRFATDERSSAPVFLDGAGSDPDATRSFSADEEDERRVSAEYRRPLGEQGSLTLALVDSRETGSDNFRFEEADSTASTFRDTELGETAARIVATRTPRESLTLRGVATGAFNFFEGDFRSFEDGVEQEIDGSNNRVEETRGSLAAEIDWNLTDAWTLQGSLGAEAYEIVTRDVSGEGSEETSPGAQVDPKGNIRISYRPLPRTTLSVEAVRDIGQLSFNQFLATSSATSATATQGASTLEPERDWTYIARLDHRFADRGVLEASLSRRRVDNPVNTAALPGSDTVFIPRNTTSETIDRISGRATVPLDRYGLNDLLVNANGSYSVSETIDPVTGESREVAGNNVGQWSVSLRQNPGDGPWSWSVSASGFTLGDFYSVRTISELEIDPSWGASVQWEPRDGLRFSANYNSGGGDLSRAQFFPRVREIGLDPSFISESRTTQDGSASFTAQWRRAERFEITASYNTGADSRLASTLTPFGGPQGSPDFADTLATPSATLRLRIFN